MNKTVKAIGVIAISILIFLGGYFAGINNRETTREVRIGYQDSADPNRIDYSTIFSDTKNQTIIDNFLMIYLQKEKLENVDINMESPDILIMVLNPKRSVGLIDSKVWFTSEGAVIAERVGESWEQVDYFKIDQSDADYIKKVIDGQEG